MKLTSVQWQIRHDQQRYVRNELINKINRFVRVITETVIVNYGLSQNSMAIQAHYYDFN